MSKGITVVSAQEALAAAPDPAGLFFGDDFHIDADGHAAVGAWLAERLRPLLPR